MKGKKFEHLMKGNQLVGRVSLALIAILATYSKTPEGNNYTLYIYKSRKTFLIF